MGNEQQVHQANALDEHREACRPAAPGAIPSPGRFTREQWLGYRVVAKLSESGLDIHRSPAVAVWAVVNGEINAWMDEHGIPRGKRPEERDDQPITPEAPRALISPPGRELSL